jgi:hypothetical protein
MDPEFRPNVDEGEDEDFGATQMDGGFGGAHWGEEGEEAEEEGGGKSPPSRTMQLVQEDDDEGGDEEEEGDENEEDEKLITQPCSRSGSQRSVGSPGSQGDAARQPQAASPAEDDVGSDHDSATAVDSALCRQASTLERGYTVGGAQGEESFASHDEDGSRGPCLDEHQPSANDATSR